MTEKRFYVAESKLIEGYCVFDKEKKYAFHPRPRKADCLNDANTLNELNDENQAVKDIINELNSMGFYRDSALLDEYLGKIARAVGCEWE